MSSSSNVDSAAVSKSSNETFGMECKRVLDILTDCPFHVAEYPKALVDPLGVSRLRDVVRVRVIEAKRHVRRRFDFDFDRFHADPKTKACIREVQASAFVMFLPELQAYIRETEGDDSEREDIRYMLQDILALKDKNVTTFSYQRSEDDDYAGEDEIIQELEEEEDLEGLVYCKNAVTGLYRLAFNRYATLGAKSPFQYFARLEKIEQDKFVIRAYSVAFNIFMRYAKQARNERSLSRNLYPRASDAYLDSFEFSQFLLYDDDDCPWRTDKMLPAAQQLYEEYAEDIQATRLRPYTKEYREMRLAQKDAEEEE